MTATPSIIQPVIQADYSEAHNTINIITALQSELAILQAKVITYYHDEIVMRGDKIMIREYCEHFGLEPATLTFKLIVNTTNDI